MRCDSGSGLDVQPGTRGPAPLHSAFQVLIWILIISFLFYSIIWNFYNNNGWYLGFNKKYWKWNIISKAIFRLFKVILNPLNILHLRLWQMLKLNPCVWKYKINIPNFYYVNLCGTGTEVRYCMNYFMLNLNIGQA
jgi:hypothetical protein